MRPRVFVSRHVFPEAIDLLSGRADVDYNDSRETLSPEALRARARDAHGLVCQLTDRIDARLLDACPGLRVVSNVAVGYDNIDVAAATERGIVVTNTPGVLTEATADLAFGLLLAVARRIPEAERFLRDGRWRQWEIDLLTGHDVHGRTLGIFGMGRIGRAVARRARGFDMRVLYHDRQRLPDEEDRALGATFADPPTLLAASDFVSLHVPLSEETRHLIGRDELELMKPTAILINTSRGAVVDEGALADVLARGRIAGAGLDVYEREPHVHPGLRESERAVLLPHVASASVATRTLMCTMAARGCLAVLEGRRPDHPVNPEALGPR